MLKQLYKIGFSMLVISAVLLTGCKKIIEIDPPLNQVTTNLVFASDKLATAARSGMFSGLALTTTQSQSLTTYSSLQADDLLYIATATTFQEFNNNSYNVLSTAPAGLFSEWYNVIYRANAIIEGLKGSTGTSEVLRNRYTAEAKFIRAYCYFNLINTFGDVPLVLVTDPTITAFQPRESISTIYNQIIADLTEAKSNLLGDYSFSSNERVGLNKFVATALLARVYLFTGNYQEAERNASEVIASPLYSLIPKATAGTAVFVKNSQESIWQMSPPVVATNQYTNEAGVFIPSAFTSVTNFGFRLDPAFTGLYSSSDIRRVSWMNHTTFSGVTYSIPFKYKYRTNPLAVAAGVSEYQTVIRLAEMYLIRAEARARTGADLPGALSDLKMIQSRAGAAESSSTTSASLLADIALENRKELFCEQAFRWYNLKRTGQADAVLGALKASYRPASKLLPIPQNAIDANFNLTQNPGY